MRASEKIVSLTRAFQDALRADIFTIEKTGEAVNLKINDAATEEEKEQVSELISEASRTEYLGRPRAEIAGDLSFAMAEIKSVIASRAGLTEQLASYVDVGLTSAETVSELETAGAPHFAKVVGIARRKLGV